MPFSWGDHVGELELHVEAATEQDVFLDATLAFGELLSGDDDPAAGGTPAERELRAEGVDLAVLLADWLDQLVFLAEVDGFVPEAVGELRLDGGRAAGTVRGRIGSPAHLVKAVTHHRLAFEPAPPGWQANVVLDV